MTGKSVYLGGPDVFLANSIEIMQEKAALAIAAGFVPNLPGDNKKAPPPAPGTPATEISRQIFLADVAMLTASDFGIFHLTPFRGVSADVGTCVEVGLMYGQGKPVFGYTNIAGDYLARVAPQQSATGPLGPGMADDMGCHIESFGNADNLMIDSAAAMSGAPIVRTDVPLPNRLTDLAGFKICLALAQAYFAAGDT
jgi:nucleoside 2-deoxyribosyltransferase